MTVRETNEARDQLHRAGVADRMRELSRREHYDAQEALSSEPAPSPASWDDVELLALGWPQHAANIRARIEANHAHWLARTTEQWEQRAAAIETKWAAHCASDDHERWLHTGGPARLWDRLQAEKAAACVDYFRDLAQWRMDELVKIYLTQAAE